MYPLTQATSTNLFDAVYGKRVAALMAADPSLSEDDAAYIAQTTPGEPTEEDLAHTRAEDRAVERAQRMGRGF